MEDLGVPLLSYVSVFAGATVCDGVTRQLTLSRTLSSEFGQSMAKQTKIRSVSGYDSGRNLSYSSCPAVSHSASSTVLPLCWCVG